MNTRFIEILRQCKELHEKKSHDYASNADSQSNFKLVEKFASIFGDIPEKHRPYIYLLGTKYARLAELLKESKVPKNESITDTFRDTIVYTGLWAARIEEDSEFTNNFVKQSVESTDQLAQELNIKLMIIAGFNFNRAKQMWFHPKYSESVFLEKVHVDNWSFLEVYDWLLRIRNLPTKNH